MTGHPRGWLGRYRDWSALRDSLEQSPGPQRLVQQAERSAQRALHALRAPLWGASGLALALAFPQVPLAVRVLYLVPWLVIFGALWLVIWHLLSRPSPPRWLGYLMVYGDGAYFLEVLLVFWLPTPAGVPLPILREVLGAVSVPLLVFLSLSGVFRIEMRAAVLSAAAALVTDAAVVATLHPPLAMSVPTLVVLVFTGIAGVVGARVVRRAVLRAGVESVLEHYVPGSLLGDLKRTGDGTGREAEVTILLADIRGFTTLVEDETPAGAFELLNDYLRVAIPPLVAEGVVVDKYLGDGILGFVEGQGQAERVLRAALTLLETVVACDLRSSGGRPLRIGVAVHTGQAMVGTIGPEERREYTIISDAVNVTSRLEELNKRFGSVLIVSESVLAAGGTLPIGVVGPEQVVLRGHYHPLRVYYLPTHFAAGAVPQSTPT